MGGLIEIAEAILSGASWRTEIAAHNIVNTTTPGYRARKAFVDYLGVPGQSTAAVPDLGVDRTPGKLIKTDNPYDLALAGAGFFEVRAGDRLLYTRAGQFSRNADGRLVTTDGMVLQSDQGDVVVHGSVVTIETDGTVFDDGEPVSRLAIVEFDDATPLRPAGAGAFAVAEGESRTAAGTLVRQGMLEASNVSMATEMVSLMMSMRTAETGQQLVRAYDDLMGRALTTFGQV